MLKRRIPLLITFFVGVLVLISEFIPHRPFNQIAGGLEDWFLIISGFAIILGQLNLIRVNTLKVKRRVQNWPYFIVTLASFGIMVLAGLFWGTQQSKGLLDGKYEQAIETFELVLQHDPDNVDAWVQIGVASSRRNRLGKAVEAYTRALELDPGKRTALTELAVVYDTRGQPELAEQTRARLAAFPLHDVMLKPVVDEQALEQQLVNLTQQSADNPASASIWLELGRTHFELKDYGAATKALLQATALAPDDTAALFLLGRSYMEGGETGTFVGGKKPFDYLFDNVYQHLSATMFALLAFFIASAAYRAFIGRTIESNLLLGAAVLVMLGNTTMGSNLTGWLPDSMSFLHLPNVSAFIMKYPNTAGQRAIMICAGLGIIGSSLRIILGIERSYLGGE
ncbi:MAG: tetratricopeptide repeat protein [Candidatus Cloacimonetes bacterium]|nr:tetratricopeptide repeat protein [Candidatus Cloacimonadota bacterium]